MYQPQTKYYSYYQIRQWSVEHIKWGACGKPVYIKLHNLCVCNKNQGEGCIAQSVYWLGFGLDVRGIVVRFLAGTERPDRLRVQPASCTMRTGRSFPWGKTSGTVADHSHSSSGQVMNEWRCISSSPYTFMSWRGANSHSAEPSEFSLPKFWYLSDLRKSWKSVGVVDVKLQEFLKSVLQGDHNNDEEGPHKTTNSLSG
jgi:hypothetical protein